MIRPLGPYRVAPSVLPTRTSLRKSLVEGGTSLPAHGLHEVVGPELVAQNGIRHETGVEGDRVLGLRDPVLADEEQDARRCQREPDRGVEREAKDEPWRGERLSTTRRGWERWTRRRAPLG